MNQLKSYKLGDVLIYEQPTKYIVESTNYSDSNKTPVLTAGQSFILGYTDEVEGVFDNYPVIIFDDFTTATKYVDFPFKVKSSAMKILKADEHKADIKYLYYLMQTIKVDSEQHKRYWISKYSKLNVKLPPLETQKKIAAILDEADKLHQLDKQLIEKYDALTQSLFLDMFGDPVTNTKGFNFPKLKDVCVVSQGMQIAIRHRKKNAGPNRFKYLTVAYLNGRKDEEYIENPRISVVCTKEDILMTRTGNTGQVVTDVEGVFHNNFFKVDWDRCRLNKTYFVAFLSHMKIKRELLKRASTTTIPDLNHGQFYDLNVIVPSIELQDQFAKRVEAIEAQKALAQKSLEKSEELFNSLLQKAFKGELV